MSSKLLRGYRLREEIARLVPVAQELHYLELVDQLHEAGFRMPGADRSGEGANVLAALQRSPGFESVAPRSGRWRRVEQQNGEIVVRLDREDVQTLIEMDSVGPVTPGNAFAARVRAVTNKLRVALDEGPKDRP